MRYRVSGLTVVIGYGDEVREIINPEGSRCISAGTGFTKGSFGDYRNNILVKLASIIKESTNKKQLFNNK